MGWIAGPRRSACDQRGASHSSRARARARARPRARARARARAEPTAGVVYDDPVRRWLWSHSHVCTHVCTGTQERGIHAGGCPLPACLRIRRLGVRVPSGAHCVETVSIESPRISAGFRVCGVGNILLIPRACRLTANQQVLRSGSGVPRMPCVDIVGIRHGAVRMCARMCAPVCALEGGRCAVALADASGER